MATLKNADIIEFKRLWNIFGNCKKTINNTDIQLGLAKINNALSVTELTNILCTHAISDLPYVESIVTGSFESRSIGNGLNVVNDSIAEIQSIEGDTIKCDNLLNIADVEETTINGITYSIKNGVITLNGTATSQTVIKPLTGASIQANSLYSIVFVEGNSSGDSNVTMALGITGDSYKYRIINTKSLISGTYGFAITNMSAPIIQLMLVIPANYTFNNQIIKPMLVEGSVAPTEFQPYFEGLKNSKLTTLTSKNAHGEVIDTLNVNFDMGKWCGRYNRQYILDNSSSFDSALVNYCNTIDTPYVDVKGGSSYTFDGTEKWARWDTTNDGYTCEAIINFAKPNGLCLIDIDVDYDNTIKVNVSNQNGYFIASSKRIIACKVGIATVTDMQQFMKGKTIHYQLATSTYTPVNATYQYKVASGGTEEITNDNAQYGVNATNSISYIVKNSN